MEGGGREEVVAQWAARAGLEPPHFPTQQLELDHCCYNILPSSVHGVGCVKITSKYPCPGKNVIFSPFY